MAKFVYTSAKTLFATKQLGWTTDTIKCIPVKAAYAAAPADDFLSDIVAGNRVATAVTITSPTAASGLCTCATVTFPTVAAGSTIAAFVFYKQGGSDATSDLIAYIGEDTGGSTFSVATNNSNVTFTPGAGGVFSF